MRHLRICRHSRRLLPASRVVTLAVVMGSGPLGGLLRLIVS
jgi:hypothetical protein